MSQYGNPEYWEDRYRKDTEPFEWYQAYQGLLHILSTFIKKEAIVLVPGCGTSSLSEDLLEKHGCKQVISVDYAASAVEAMQKRSKSDKLKFLVMDCRNLDVPSLSVDSVVDKGLLDCLVCGEDADKQTHLVLSEYSRVTKAGGAVVIVSFGAPATRMALLQDEKFGWLVKPVITVAKPSLKQELEAAPSTSDGVHYCYICVKKS